jgi:hypothetical protein
LEKRRRIREAEEVEIAIDTELLDKGIREGHVNPSHLTDYFGEGSPSISFARPPTSEPPPGEKRRVLLATKVGGNRQVQLDGRWVQEAVRREELAFLDRFLK